MVLSRKIKMALKNLAHRLSMVSKVLFNKKVIIYTYKERGDWAIYTSSTAIALDHLENLELQISTWIDHYYDEQDTLRAYKNMLRDDDGRQEEE